jgi:hypothetical protein
MKDSTSWPGVTAIAKMTCRSRGDWWIRNNPDFLADQTGVLDGLTQ